MKGEWTLTINGSSQIWNWKELHFEIGSSLNSYRDIVLIFIDLECPCWWDSWEVEKWVESCWGWEGIKSQRALKFIWVC